MPTQKPKTCKVCRVRFIPLYSTLQPVCSNVHCVLEYAKLNKHKKEKRELKAMREHVKSISDWRRDLQQVFNQFIRLRDADKGCISCCKPLLGKYDAGHYFSVGSYPNLRFAESNVHGQCVECNQHKHGNLIEYGIQLEKRIGKDKIAELHALKNGRLSMPLDDIKTAIYLYKQKIKELKK